jgi:hypothetical protein
MLPPEWTGDPAKPYLPTSLFEPKIWAINSIIPWLVSPKVPPFSQVTFPGKRGTMIEGALRRNTVAWERFQCGEVETSTP